MKFKRIKFLFFLLVAISMISLFALAQGVGYIQIKCEPGATVFLDNKLVGNTTSELGGLILQDVPAGSHEVKIVKEGYNPQSIKITLKVNEVYLYEVFLKQKTGALLVETIPIDCIIEIPKLNIDKEHEGNKIEKTWEVSIPIGSYRINFLALGKKVKYDLEIEEGTRKHLLVNILKNEVKELLPILTWDRTYGGDSARSLIQTTDGGYAVAGITKSKGVGKQDVWVVKLDSKGNLQSGVSKLDYETETETEANTTSIQTITVPIFDSYQWEVGIPGFAKPGEITKFKDTTISIVQLSSPSNGTTLPPGDITFSWDPVSNATKYQCIIHHSLGKGTVDTSSTSFTISLGTEETITWKVRAGDNSGNWGAWSSIWSLTIKSLT